MNWNQTLSLLLTITLLSAVEGYTQDNRDLNDLGNLKYYQMANARLPSLSAGDKRVVFMGNSITEFWFSTDTTFSKGKPYINRGISGQTSMQMLIRFRQDVIDLHPELVVILGGINDIAENMGPTTPEATRNNIISMTELAQAHDIKVVICSVLPAFDFSWHPGLEPAEKIISLNRLLESYCSENKIPFVDFHTSMADERKGLKYEYGEDGVHPNLKGYKFMESILEPVMAKALHK